MDTNTLIELLESPTRSIIEIYPILKKQLLIHKITQTTKFLLIIAGLVFIAAYILGKITQSNIADEIFNENDEKAYEEISKFSRLVGIGIFVIAVLIVVVLFIQYTYSWDIKMLLEL